LTTGKCEGIKLNGEKPERGGFTMNRKRDFVSIVSVIAIIVAAFIFTAFGLQNSSEHKVLFEKAKFMMETKGDLDGAIALFEEIIAKYPGEREYAAKSQYYIGLCFEKLGQNQSQKAQDAYQKVVQNYPEQTQVVQRAQEKLTVIFRAQVFLETGSKNFRIQKVGTEGALGAPSPDGHYFSFVDWESGNGELAIMDLATREKHRLTHPSPGDESWYFVDNSLFSPDGKKLAFTRWKDDDSGELRIINADGSDERILWSSKDFYFWLNDWTSDSKYILGLIHGEKDNSNHMALVSVSNGDVHAIKDLDSIDPRTMQFCSCGRWIAFDYPQAEDSDKCDILLIKNDGSREITLVKHPADDRLLGWTRDGHWLLFLSDRSGTWDAWIIPVKEGRAIGETSLVKQNIGPLGIRGISPLGFTQDGSFYYNRGLHRQDIYVSTLNIEKVKLTIPPKKASLRFEGSNSDPNWSPDGKCLAYISRRDPDLKASAICIQNMENGEGIELSPKLENFGRMSWFSDGKSLLGAGRDKNVHGLHKVDARTGRVSILVPGAGRTGFHSPRISPDAKYVFYESDSWEEGTFRIMRYNLETNQEKEIYRSEWQILEMDVSPDGELLAFWEGRDNTIKVIPVEGGKAKLLYELDSGGILSVVWSPDGKYIFFSKVGEGEGKVGRCELWRISREGGEAIKYPLEADGMEDLSFHPDGRQIAFNSGHHSNEIWVMENFLPKTKEK
jgi:Tol biopolymer transport system component